MIIRFPWQASKTDAIHTVVEKAARRAGMSSADYMLMMTYFFEEVTTAVCRGKTVTIAGFGKWGPHTHVGKKPTTMHLPPVCLPRFYAARGFNNEVRTTCMPRAVVDRSMEAYRGNHNAPMANPITRERTCTSMAAVRRVLMQASKGRVRQAEFRTGCSSAAG